MINRWLEGVLPACRRQEGKLEAGGGDARPAPVSCPYYFFLVRKSSVRVGV